MNAIRRAHPALHGDWNLRFHRTDNPELICYSKRSDDGLDPLLMVVNAGSVQHAARARAGCRSLTGGSRRRRGYDVIDLLSNERYTWRGEWNYVRLDPQGRMAHILHVQLPAVLSHVEAAPVSS